MPRQRAIPVQPTCSEGRGRLAERSGAALLLLASCIVSCGFAHAEAQPASLPVTVAEPFVEIHTGPGRSYPVFHVAEQDEQLEILLAKTQWYKVRTRNGQTGWSKAADLARTLKPTGVPLDLPSIDHGDYVKSRWRIGFTTGEFEGAETNSLIGGYRFWRWAAAEVEIGHIFSINVDSSYYSLNLLAEPFPQWAITPFATLSLGQMHLDPEQRLRNRDIDISRGEFYGLGLGANYYVGRNFVIRGEYRFYSVTADNNDTIGVEEWKVGFSSFF